YILAHCLISVNGKGSTLAIAVGKDRKGILSVIIYAAGIALCFVNPWFGLGSYTLVTATWLIPDRRIEDRFEN
ncbi:MAG: hypothetical protein H0W12_11900, partial [Chitinophagaceae bacterium]|nr:hypothetical protein [Chitinophagaceae bacterium]